MAARENARQRSRICQRSKRAKASALMKHHIVCSAEHWPEIRTGADRPQTNFLWEQETLSKIFPDAIFHKMATQLYFLVCRIGIAFLRKKHSLTCRKAPHIMKLKQAIQERLKPVFRINVTAVGSCGISLLFQCFIVPFLLF